MSQDESRSGLIDDVARYYDSKLAAHGTTPAGVDWNSDASHALRFEQFMPLLDGEAGVSIGDYGCGYGALLEYLRRRGWDGPYLGFDAAKAMVAAGAARHAGDRRVRFVATRAGLEPSDYTIASGIFNVRLAVADDRWRDYMLDTIRDIASVSRRGFGFNALSTYSDRDRRRGDLYYADPRDTFDYCMQLWPRRVMLRHDYDLYEFTILVRL
jgi:SAM-dependent methyltransferase